jgi:hypothetical protein
MIYPTPIKALLTMTFESLVMQLSGSLARGTRLMDQFVHTEPTPASTMAFELELSTLLREVGRRMMAWTLNGLEPDAEAPSRVAFAGRLYRRRRKHPHSVATLFGPVVLRRRLYEPLGRRGRCLHPLELRLEVTDEGHHPSAYYHPVLKKRVDPRRPWRRLEGSRMVDFDHASQYVQQLADTIFGAGSEAQSWAKQRRQVLKTKTDGVARVLKSASALRRSRGRCGQAKLYEKAYRYINKRTQWMRYHLYKRQHLPLGSGIPEVSQL